MARTRVHLISFAAGSLRWNLAGKRLAKEARRTGRFASVRVYDERSLYSEIPTFGIENPELGANKVRGWGFWLWRPYLLRLWLQRLRANDVVVFLDAGCQINWNPASEHRFDNYLEQVSTFGSVAMYINQSLSTWCKSDTLHAFGLLRSAPSIMLLEPGVLLLRNTGRNLALMDAWIKWGRADDYHHIDDSPSKAVNSIHFREHRHDQALLTCLNENFRLNSIPQETYFARSWTSQGFAFPFWAMRNNTPFRFYTKSITSRLITPLREIRQDRRNSQCIPL